MMSSMADGGMGPGSWPDPDPDHELTWRQQRILQVIRDFGERRGYAPTLREIGEAAELASPSSVSYQVSVLQRKGFLRRTPGRPRTIELCLPGQPAVRLEGEDLADAVNLSPRDLLSVPVPLCGQIVKHVLTGSLEGARAGYRVARTELGEVAPPHAVDAALAAYQAEGRRLAAAVRSAEVVERALRGGLLAVPGTVRARTRHCRQQGQGEGTRLAATGSRRRQ